MPENLSPGGEPSLDAVRRSDEFVDALAAGRPVTPQDQTDAALAALLGGWRDDIRSVPDADLVSEQDAIAALDKGLAVSPAGARRERSTGVRRGRRGLSVVGAVAAGMLAIGGFGAVVAGSGPGDPLYGLRSILFGVSKQVRDDQVALAARTELNQVQDLIARGDWQQAEEKLVAVSTQVDSIADEQQKQEILDTWNDLSAKVVEQNPEATVPPGITYTVPPEANELVPAVATPETTSESPQPTTTPSAPTTATTPVTSLPATAATTPVTTPITTPVTTPVTTPATTAGTTAGTTTKSPVTTSATTPATTPATTAATTATATTRATTSTTPTAAATAPNTAATTAATTAPASPITTSAAQSPAAASPATTTATAVPAAPTTTVAPAAPATPTTAATAQTAEAPTQAPVTTTIVVPVPEAAG